MLALLVVLAGVAEALAQNCKPRRARPPVVVTGMGPCAFDSDTLSFAGDAPTQAACLLRAFDRSRNIGPPLERLPEAIASRVGRDAGLPERETLAAHLADIGLVWDYGSFLWRPLARAGDNDPGSPQTRYLVIHDTSGPFYGNRPFPPDIDNNRAINNLARFRCSDGWEVAHVIVNRTGSMLLGHEFSEPWRATKFERGSQFGASLKGLFMHIELIQPRRRAPGRRNNDAEAPLPGFSVAQYERLALIYVIASVRAERWLIPAFHGPIDAGIRGGHDDPQNFELDAFADAIEQLAATLDRRATAAHQAMAAMAAGAEKLATVTLAKPEPDSAADVASERRIPPLPPLSRMPLEPVADSSEDRMIVP